MNPPKVQQVCALVTKAIGRLNESDSDAEDHWLKQAEAAAVHLAPKQIAEQSAAESQYSLLKEAEAAAGCLPSKQGALKAALKHKDKPEPPPTTTPNLKLIRKT